MTLSGTKVGHIRVERPIGKGGMGEVYLGFNEALKKRVALKALRAGRRLDARTRARFLREARILSRLEHPNICRIHDYVEGDETDFLVLELIEGRSLSKAIEDGLDHATKLRIAVQIADVLAEAHAAGVVHRDLKPGNVMLAREDDVKVLDFGLARPVEVTPDSSEVDGRVQPVAAGQADPMTLLEEVEEEESDPATAPAAEMSADVYTRAGTLVGTPAYMSPEQARGEPVTWASDMYSFGLLLQMLFTERSPYDESVPGFVLVRQAARAETLPVTGLHADLTRLIERLKSPAPASRPTAVEAGARLARIRDKPRRRMRRLVAAAAVLVLALAGAKYALDLRHERGIARQRQAQAERLIVYHLGDLREKLEPLGRLDILSGIGDTALEYFESVDESMLSADELSRYATALAQIGQVRMAQGNLEGADEAFRESLSRAERLAARDPNNGDWQKGLGEAYFWLGYVRWERGDVDGALEQFQSYKGIAETLAAREPDVSDWQLELAYGHTNIGSVLEAKGNLEGAVAEYRAALEIKQSLAEASPGNPDLQQSLTVTHEDIAGVFRSLGKLEEAESHYRKSVEIKRALVDLEPDNALRMEDLGVGLSLLGALLLDRDDTQGALEQYRADLELSERLVERDPANARWRRGAAISHYRMGVGLQDADPTAALSQFKIASTWLSELLDDDPARNIWRRDLAAVDIAIAKTLEKQGELERAERAVNTAREVLETVRAALPDDRESVEKLGRAYLVQGTIYERQGREADARTAWQLGLEVVEPIARDSEEIEFLDVWARILLRLDRTEDAATLVGKLRRFGYRKKSLDELLRDKGLTT